MDGRRYYMELAINETLGFKGLTSPNPIVGAVVVKGGKVLSRACCRRAGLPHVERRVAPCLKNVEFHLYGDSSVLDGET